MQSFIIAILRKQSFVGTTFHDTTFVEHTYLVSILDGAQTVGDSYGSTCLHQSLKRILY